MKTDIYVITRNDCDLDRDRYHRTVTTLEEDFGYFTDGTAASAKVNELNKDVLAEYATHGKDWKKQKFIRRLAFSEWTHYVGRIVYALVKVEAADPEQKSEEQKKLDAITSLFWRLDNTTMTAVTFRREIHEVHKEIPYE